MVGLALGLTFPIWLTVNYLGSPDNGAILAAYIGSEAWPAQIDGSDATRVRANAACSREIVRPVTRQP